MHENDNQTTGQRLGGALINVLIFLCFIIAMTFLLVFMYKQRCYRVSMVHEILPSDVVSTLKC